MTAIKILPSQVQGQLVVPPSKSHTLRAILFASMARGKSTIKNILLSPDTEAMIQACRQLGAEILQDNTLLEITGVAGNPRLPDDIIDVGNSGQVLRFVGAIAALLEGTVVITGDYSVRHHRPLLPLIQGLEGLGAQCTTTKGDGYAPVIIKGPIAPGETTLDGQDSQPVSGLLIASAFLKGTTHIHVNHPGETPWVALTLDWLKRLGVPCINTGFQHYRVEGGKPIQGFEYCVPGDCSTMAFPVVAALITQSSLVVKGIDLQDIQGDKKIIDVLCQMGARITVDGDQLTILPSGTLRGCDIDVNDMIDALPILAVVGCYVRGTTRLLNANIARKKESDRLSAMTTGLKKMGADIQEYESHLVVKQSVLHGAEMDSHLDHRVAMALVVAAMGAATPSIVHRTDCIAKSYSDFMVDFQHIGAFVHA